MAFFQFYFNPLIVLLNICQPKLFNLEKNQHGQLNEEKNNSIINTEKQMRSIRKEKKKSNKNSFKMKITIDGNKVEQKRYSTLLNAFISKELVLLKKP